jgi:hypothetical protein
LGEVQISELDEYEDTHMIGRLLPECSIIRYCEYNAMAGRIYISSQNTLI